MARQAAPRRIEAAVAPEGRLLWPWGWLSRCPQAVAVIVGYARDRLHTLSARKRAGASFLIMTRPLRRSLTGLS